jgi:TnpA family transposase
MPLREAAFALDGLLEHDTELDPRVCYTDTHGYTEVVMATAALLGFELAPRIKDIKDQTLYKMDRSQYYTNLDPILTGTVKTHLVRQAWDETVWMITSIHDRIVSASLILRQTKGGPEQGIATEVFGPMCLILGGEISHICIWSAG